MFSNLKKLSSTGGGGGGVVCQHMLNSSLARSQLKSFEEIPSPGGLPFLGHLLPFLRNSARLDKLAGELQTQLGDIIRLSLPGFARNGTMVMLFKPQHIKSLYTQEEEIPNVPGFDMIEYSRNHELKNLFNGKGFFTNTEDWYKVRSLAQQDMMRPKSALYYIGDIEKIAQEVMDVVEKEVDGSHSLDVVKVCQRYSLESVSVVFLGSRLGALAGEEDGRRLIEIADSLGPTSQNLLFVPSFIAPHLPQYKRWISSFEEAFYICEKHIQKALEKLSDESQTILSKLYRKSGGDTTLPTVIAIDALLAGIDTTGTAASFLLYHLATNPDKQEILYQEISQIIGPSGRLTEAALAKMKYTKAVQRESQRILPSIWMTSRVYNKDLVIGGYNIPQGTGIARVGSFSSMDPESFPSPDKFQPERWLRQHEDRHRADPNANLPFGHGKRACIGQRFAKLELLVLMVKLVQTYQLEYAGTGKVGGNTKFITVPDKPVRIKFNRRQ